MPIELNCEACGQRLRIPDEAAGKQARCPKCQAIMMVPADGSEAASFNTDTLRPDQLPPPNEEPNPFAAPQSMPEKPVGKPVEIGDEIRPRAVPAGEVFGDSITLWQQNLGLMVATGFVVVSISGALAGVGNALQEQDAVAAGFTVQFVQNVINLFLGIGQNQIMLRIARGQKASFGDLFGGGPDFLPVFGASLLAGIAVTVACALFIIPGIILMVMFWPFYYLLIDHKAGVIESFSIAGDIGKQNIGTAILLWLGAVGFILLGCLAACVGVYFAQPLIAMMFAVAYLKMASQIP